MQNPMAEMPAEQSDFPPEFVTFVLWFGVELSALCLMYFDIFRDSCAGVAGVVSEVIWQPAGIPPCYLRFWLLF